MATKKAAGKDATKGETKEKQRTLRVFPTNIGSMTREERATLSFKPDSMAATIIQGLEKHGVEPGEKRKQVISQVKAKFKDASDSTIRTQVYRGVVYARTDAGKLAGE